jgi:hypothetical protein
MKNYLEQQLEELIRAATQTAIGTTIPAVGWRQPSLAGTAKASALTRVLVKVLPRASEKFGSRIASLDALIHVQVSVSASADGDLLTEIEGAVIEMLDAWNRDPEAMTAALSVDTVFGADGFIFTAGGDCDFDDSKACWYSMITVQIKGRLLA